MKVKRAAVYLVENCIEKSLTGKIVTRALEEWESKEGRKKEKDEAGGGGMKAEG